MSLQGHTVITEKSQRSGKVLGDWRNIVPIFKKGKKGLSRELKASQSHFGDPWENHEVSPLGSHFWAHKGKGKSMPAIPNHQGKKIMLDQPDCLL